MRQADAIKFIEKRRAAKITLDENFFIDELAEYIFKLKNELVADLAVKMVEDDDGSATMKSSDFEHLKARLYYGYDGKSGDEFESNSREAKAIVEIINSKLRNTD